MSRDATTIPIRVLIVDDSAFMRTALSRMIASEPGLEVAGTASTGTDALAKIPALTPDVTTLDVEMPGLGGLETLRRIMVEFPHPVIMVSAVTEKDAETTFKALAAGAFDYIPKHLSSTSLDILHIQPDLVAKIRAAAVSWRRFHAFTEISRKPPRSAAIEYPDLERDAPAVVVLGISTGGPKALQEILPLLPRDLPVPVLVVQHMPPGFTGPFAQRLNSLCSVTVREAAHRDRLEPGVVYIAPAGKHMIVERASDSRVSIRLDSEPDDTLHIPSVDVTMKAAAEVFGNLTMGVIMTGMGSDGTSGMQAIYREGGITIGQDEATCAVYGMPRACAELGILQRMVPLLHIPTQITQATRSRKFTKLVSS
jgi:two-component system chemotaxis response regulator CheB